MIFSRHLFGCLATLVIATGQPLDAAGLQAGAAKVDITDHAAGPVNDPMYAKALVLKSDSATVVLITLDAVAVGEIGRIGNGFMGIVRTQLKKDLGIPPQSVLVNASHCHGVVRADTPALAVRAVKEAWQALTPVKVGAGRAMEDRISENRRLTLKDGSEADMRRAYSLPADEDVASVGPIDPEVGLLRIDREDGSPLALLYNFACHPIMGVPSGGNTADYPAFASAIIEEGLGHGALAFFVQGCGGDINPVRYKAVSELRDAEALGHRLGLTALRASGGIQTSAEAPLTVVNQTLSLPRGSDLESRMLRIQEEQVRLLAALRPTNINFKTFLPLLIQQRISPDQPGFHAQGYLHEQALGRDAQAKLDADNRSSVEAYLKNIQIMEQLTRLNTNLALLKKHHEQNLAAATPTLDVEVAGLRIGDFRMVTFPGELTVRIGLNLKKAAPYPLSFVAGYTNGYIYYAPTAEQRLNKGYAQEDCDSLVAPEWQAMFEQKALEILNSL
jgi:hypothetical protein